MTTTPAGWYPDPHDASRRRYWDGAVWTEHVDQPAAALPPSPPAPPVATPTQPLAPVAWTPPPPRPQDWYRKPWVVGAGAVVAVAVLVSAVSGGGGDDPEPVSSPAQPTVTVTADPAPATSESAPADAAPPAATVAPASEAAKATPKPKPKPSPTHDDGAWTMPDEVGKDLQAAQDHIQGVTDNPFFFTDSADATGADRFQILDVDWTVCSQKPAAGEPFDEDTDIVFYVVKDWESCP
jgi:hypothetical protein